MQKAVTPKKASLGLPLTLAAVGTVAGLFLGKRWHVACGIALAGLSVWHGWQHRQKMARDAKNLLGENRTWKNIHRRP
ncbi:MAG: hypothetical protein IJ849_05275 [Selenomonadaceae bacterium]|nr:hypothetical protein [Selenomonadaceae bacterium]